MIILTTAIINNHLVFCVDSLGRVEGLGIHNFYGFFSHKPIKTPIINTLDSVWQFFYRTVGALTLGDLL